MVDAHEEAHDACNDSGIFSKAHEKIGTLPQVFVLISLAPTITS